MSTLELSVAKTGQQTCTINGIRLHSAYDPIREAQRFVSSLDVNFTPSLIVVTEPALSYCATFLRQSFPLSMTRIIFTVTQGIIRNTPTQRIKFPKLLWFIRELWFFLRTRLNISPTLLLSKDQKAKSYTLIFR